MAFVEARFLQRVEEGCLEPDGTVLGDADLHRDFVGLQEPDSPDFLAEQVGVLGDARDGFGPVLFPQLSRDATRDSVTV